MASLKNPKHELMVQEYMKNGGNQIQAMLAAYPSRKKWSRNSQDANCSKLFKDNKIIIRLEELQKQLAARHEDFKDQMVEDLKIISKVNIADYYDIDDNGNPVLKSMAEWTEPMKRACNGLKPVRNGWELTVYGITYPYQRLAALMGLDAPIKKTQKIQIVNDFENMSNEELNDFINGN